MCIPCLIFFSNRTVSIKKKLLALFTFLFNVSVSYPATINLNDINPFETAPQSLESVLGNVKYLFRLPDYELPAIEKETNRRITHLIEQAEHLYRCAKYHDNEALESLKEMASGTTVQAVYACVLLLKYYSTQAAESNAFSSEYEFYLDRFLNFLSEKVSATACFIEGIEDAILNFTLATYHQMSGSSSIAISYAKASIKQGCIDGYNILGRIYEKTKPDGNAVECYFKAAKYSNPKGMYKLARICSKLNKNLNSRVLDLHKHAAIRKFSKAHFILGRDHEKARRRNESYNYFAYLVKIDPYLYVHMEQKIGFGHTAFYIARKLLESHPHLLPPLLKSIYEHNPNKRKEVSHFLAMGYSLGKYGFQQSKTDACSWLKISADVHGDIEDAYHLCCISATDYQRRDLGLDVINICRRVANSCELSKKYANVPQILLARLLTEEAEKKENPHYFEEAAYWFLKALNRLEEDSNRRRRIVWRIPKTNNQGRFLEIENVYEEAIDRATTPLQKQQVLRELGFHHLWGGFNGVGSLKKALNCFLESRHLLPTSSYFYAAAIDYYLANHRLAGSIHGNAEGTLTFCHHPIMVSFTDEQVMKALNEARLNDPAAYNTLGVIYLAGYESETLSIRPNPAYACENFQNAALQGHIGAMLNLANGFKSGWFGLKDINKAMFWFNEASIRRNIKATYQMLAQLLNNYRDLTNEEITLLKNKIRELSFSNLEDAALSLAFWFHSGMYGLSASKEHEIHWLKLAASKGQTTAQRILKLKYPLVLPLTEEEHLHLAHLHTHTNNQPDFVIVGGGITGVMTALTLANAAKQGRIKIGTIKLIDQNEQILTGASMVVARQHRGGEYVKDRTTANQCLYSAALWQQMFRTKRMLTAQTANDFLLAKASNDLSDGDDGLREAELRDHYTFLNERYKEYLSQLSSSGVAHAEGLLFGAPPIFRNLESEELRTLGLDNHFAAGISTGEQGFHPVGMGTLLESLLRFHNVEIITGYNVTEIEPLFGKGFRVRGRGLPPIYGRYLINAAWYNNQHLAKLIKRFDQSSLVSNFCSNQGSAVHSPSGSDSDHSSISDPKRVFLRCLALVDTSKCTVPKDRSFFGVVGKHGGMVSFFNDQVATIFIPGEGFSYQGEYILDESTVDTLPHAAKRKLHELATTKKMDVAQKILDNAKTKYPFLEQATVKTLYVQTTVSENGEIFKREHSNAKWVDRIDGCLQVCATKATYGPFAGLQALARFVADESATLHPSFSETESRFLSDLLRTDMFKEDAPIENVVLPDCFKLVADDSFMTEGQFLAAMRRYAFQRPGLDFAMFEAPETASAGMNPANQFKLISQEVRQEIDLEHHILTAKIAEMLFSLLERAEGELKKVTLGALVEETNDDEEDELGGATLNQLQKDVHLRNLTLRGWNLTFSSRFTPLGALASRLQEVHLKGVTLTLKSVQTIFGGEALALKRLSVVCSNPKKAALKALINGILRYKLEYLDLTGNSIGDTLGEETDKELERLVVGSQELRFLSLHNNKIFDSISLVSSEFDLPSELVANPFLLAIVNHPHLRDVGITDNGSASPLLQDRLDSYLSKRKPSVEIVM